MKIAQEKMAELQKLAKEKGGDIANKASEKASQLPGADKVSVVSGTDVDAAVPPIADRGSSSTILPLPLRLLPTYQLMGAIPGLSDLSSLRQLAQEKGGDFEKLLNETVEELKALLEKKGKQAKELSSQTVDEAKSKTGK